jgi:aspartyl-tRNA(Asn)/glutamyl-tRNA(Gln) amidotransferase subunit A
VSDLARKTIHDLAPLIERREVSPVEVTREVLARIDALDRRLHAFITVRPDEALAAARQAELEIGRGEYRGPLHGVPIGIKDNIAVAGWPATNGSAAMRDFVPDYDATAVTRLREAGALILGKNNQHEWALSGTSLWSAFGRIHNPWDEARVPGGSSGGSAAAVSASLAYASVGSDNRGSVRIPASYCGVVGLKATYGLVSRFGQLPATSATTDHLGPLAKDVTDAALLLNVLAGHDPADPTSIRSEPKDYTDGIRHGVRGLRVGVPRNFFFEQAAEDVQILVRQAIEQLEVLGAELRPVDLPSLRHLSFASGGVPTEMGNFLLPLVKQGRSAFTDPMLWERLVIGQFSRAADAIQAARIRNLIGWEFKAAMEQVDLLAMPTMMTCAPTIEDALDPAKRVSDGVIVLTAPFNLNGMPTISVPCGFTGEGLPVGLSLAGRHWEDHLVLRAAYAYEQATSGGYAVPPIAQEQAVGS